MRTIIILSIILLVIIGCVFGLYYYKEKVNIDTINVGCQEDAKVCPDGSVVVRIPPDCDFEECPDSNNPCYEIGCSSESIYAGSINSDKYYSCDCRWAKNLLPENVVCYKTDEQALADNRTKSEC